MGKPNRLLGWNLSSEIHSWKYVLFCLEMILWSCYTFLTKVETGQVYPLGQIQLNETCCLPDAGSAGPFEF